MFRTLGLRHLPVVNKEFELQGIITRRNFIEPHHKAHHKATSFELTTMRMFMPPATLPAPRPAGMALENGAAVPMSSLAPPPTTVNGDLGETTV